MFTNVRRLLLGSLVVLAAAVFISALLDSRWRVESTIQMRATPSDVHRFVGDFDEWERWAQWRESEDPDVSLHSEGLGAGSVQRIVIGGVERARMTMLAETSNGVDVEVKGGSVEGKQTIRYEALTSDTTRVVWHDEGRFTTPLVSGLLAYSMKAKLSEHHAVALRRLRALAESSFDQAKPSD
ncbi:MAG: SRPBCC family protein [Myxococcota bacterium]